MISRRLIGTVAATLMTCGIAISSTVTAATAASLDLKDGETKEWVIWPTYSSTFNFGSGPQAKQFIGDEYRFNAQPGDKLEISVKVKGGNLSPTLVLIPAQTGQPVASDNIVGKLTYQVPAGGPSGQYRFLVMAQGDTKGIYSVSLTRTNQPVAAQPADTRKAILENEFKLNVMDGCPASTSGLVVAAFKEANGQTYTYCAQPNRFIQAGNYAYNPTTKNLEAATSASTAPAAKPAAPCVVQVGDVCIVR